jgi:hypothetical protein
VAAVPSGPNWAPPPTIPFSKKGDGKDIRERGGGRKIKFTKDYPLDFKSEFAFNLLSLF